MVEDRITAGDRIAEVLRAEIDGREAAGFDRLSVVETAGTPTVRADGDAIAEFDPLETGLTIRFRAGHAVVQDAAADLGLDTRSADDAVTVRVDAVAETKRAADLLLAVAKRRA